MAPHALTGARYSLVPFTERDVSACYLGWLRDPEVTRFMEARFAPQTMETALAYLRSYYGHVERYLWGVMPSGGEALIGTVSLTGISRLHGCAEIGLMIGEKAYWGRGASTEALRLVIAFAFDTLGLRRLAAGTYAPNHAMNFAFGALGFRLEGKLREACLLTPGVYVDGYRWGLLAEEWRGRHEPAAGP